MSRTTGHAVVKRIPVEVSIALSSNTAKRCLGQFRRSQSRVGMFARSLPVGRLEMVTGSFFVVLLHQALFFFSVLPEPANSQSSWYLTSAAVSVVWQITGPVVRVAVCLHCADRETNFLK